MSKRPLPLRCDHCRCPACGEDFNSTYAFDWHRRGEHGVNRRCLSVPEMLAIGMALNDTDWWVTSKMPSKAISAMACEPGTGDRAPQVAERAPA